jgi:putative endonuclease
VGGKRLGDRGEAIAAEYLEAHGWTVLHRNFRLRHREIDLVVRRGVKVAFVEVKTRAGSAFGHPLEAITRRKQKEIQQVAAAWLHRHGTPSDTYQFDAVAILLPFDGPPTIEHLEDAWRG